ncbi:membrane lipoprotein lipid attachment site-containing protein [Neisseria montereyensis]|uniref:Type IV secretion system putative lipoprotein virB7 n=1 Tax=Neisseria montereyensis TaxID=2973938 RepID=A0ABT2FCA2_9NEIS|nr:membrane lipoprotein lipid attachment site-containing protein [Neisseria montereyensis]MCS4533768.1 membrane lipoprotein lipid attachment site-containing protein [Neisseria montereyensis]
MKRITLLITAALTLSACNFYQDESRQSRILRFTASHPVAAQAIGLKDESSSNITSIVTRISTRVGLDDKANGGGRGTQVNALRHTLWQAAISSRFGKKIAEEIGNAYETDPSVREVKTKYFSRFASDQAVDLRNNRIGRFLGASYPNTDIKTLAQITLKRFYEDGLWTANLVNEKGRSSWRIGLTKLKRSEYKAALDKLNKLNDNGFTEDEQQNELIRIE